MMSSGMESIAHCSETRINITWLITGRHTASKPKRSKAWIELINQHRQKLNGCVLWDAAMPDTANLALMLAAQEDLLPVEGAMETWAKQLGLVIRHDLRGKWQNRVDLYAWAFAHLFDGSKPGAVACVEPGWQRPEFVDYLVQQKIFTYSLSSRSKGWGDTLLLLLAFGPAWLREVIFSLRLDGPLRQLGLALMSRRSAEVRAGDPHATGGPGKSIPDHIWLAHAAG